jgi:hypothetical protein
MIPLYGFLQGDTVGLLVLADESDTVADLVRKLAAAARVRVKTTRSLQLIFRGQPVDEELTLREARIEALDRFDVVEVERS